jgi:hypothetical protein
MLQGERVHDSTSLMTGLLAAGRHGAWAVGELMLLSAFKNRFSLGRLAALPPPAVSTVPQEFQEVRTLASAHLYVLYRVPLELFGLFLLALFFGSAAVLILEAS